MSYFLQSSERLQFRKLTREDIPVWTTFFIDNDHLKYLGIDLTLSPETHATDWIEKQFTRYKKSGLGHLAIELKQTNEFIGVGGIIPREIDGNQELEIAYSLIPKYWKNGYGTEAAGQFKQYGLRHIDVNRFISIIAKENKNSIRVAEKNNLSILKESEFLGMEVYIYGIEK